MTSSWTTKYIPDLTAKVAIVIGANTGIGYEMARALARSRASRLDSDQSSSSSTDGPARSATHSRSGPTRARCSSKYTPGSSPPMEGSP